MPICINIYIKTLLRFKKCLMRDSERQEKMTSISGRNFSGSAMIKASALQLEVTDFRKHMFFKASIGDRQLDKVSQKLSFTMSIQELFEELITNKKMQISDENMLIIPIELTYKERKIQVKLRIPLKINNIRDSQQKCGKLFEYIEKLTKERQKQEQDQSGKMINFKSDEWNKYQNKFEVSDNQCVIKMIGKIGMHWTFSHHEALQKNGLFYFKVKIIHTANKIVLLGICGKSIRWVPNAYLDPLFMGLYLYNGELYANGKATQTQAKINIVQGKSIFMVQIDTRKNKIAWLLDDVLLHRADITKELTNTDMHPFINMYSQGDIVELIHQ